MPRAIINPNRPNEYTEVLCLDEPGAGGMCHRYGIYEKEVDPEKGGQKELALVPFQDGPIKEVGVNGPHHEDYLIILIDRLEHAQKGPYACEENYQALIHLKTALLWLNYRTNSRTQRGVEGTSAK